MSENADQTAEKIFQQKRAISEDLFKKQMKAYDGTPVELMMAQTLVRIQIALEDIAWELSLK